jgi:Mg-chelatase subunit ChlD
MVHAMPWSFGLIVAIALLVLGPLGAHAHEMDLPFCTVTGPYTVCTDQDDYAPSSIVYMGGTGFAPSASLTVRVTRPDLAMDSGSVTTASDGSFQHEYDLDGIVGLYTIDVLSGAVVLASHTFTDAPSVNCTGSGGTNQGDNCTLTFAAVVGDVNPADRTFTYTSSNSTDDTGVISSVNDGGDGWLSVAPLSFAFTHPGSELFTVSVDTTGLSAGMYTGTITLNPNGSGNNRTVTVNLLMQAVANPELEASCGLDIVLVIDGSGSIDNTEYAQMQAAFVDFVEAFLVDSTTPTEFALVEFATSAVVRLNFTSDAQTIIDEINEPRVQPGGQFTNWDDGLLEARNLFPNRSNPDLLVFSSDGNPNRRGGHTDLGHSATVQTVSESAAMD